MKEPIETLDGLAEYFQDQLAITVDFKYFRTGVAARGHMAYRSGAFDA